MSEQASESPYDGIEERYDDLNRESGPEGPDEVGPVESGRINIPETPHWTPWGGVSSSQPYRMSLHTAMPNVSAQRGGITWTAAGAGGHEEVEEEEETMLSDAQETRAEAVQQARFVLERREGDISIPPPLDNLIRLAEWIIGEG